MNRFLSRLSAVALGVFTFGVHAYAQVFQGSGLNGGVGHAGGISGLAGSMPIRAVITRVLNSVLNFLALIAVIVVIIAGFYLILSLGEDDQKEKAKKTIYYVLIGLAVILFARVIVGLVTVFLASRVNS